MDMMHLRPYGHSIQSFQFGSEQSTLQTSMDSFYYRLLSILLLVCFDHDLAKSGILQIIPSRICALCSNTASQQLCQRNDLIQNILLLISGRTSYCPYSYFDAMIYLNDANLQPLQLVLRSILVQNTPQPGMIADIQSTAEMAKVAEQLKYATIVVSSLPLLVMYPFFQKYFDQGIMVGSVKG